jgi:hypothetical protein
LVAVVVPVVVIVVVVVVVVVVVMSCSRCRRTAVAPCGVTLPPALLQRPVAVAVAVVCEQVNQKKDKWAYRSKLKRADADE